MAIVNRTPDSFYDQGATFARGRRRSRPSTARSPRARTSSTSAGSRPGPATRSTRPRRSARTAGFVAAVRDRHPDLVISVDTWRHEVGRVCCEAGADVLNDAWGGADPKLAEVAAEFDVGLVCTHAGGLAPRTRPHRVGYDDVVADIVSRTVSEAERAVALGVDRDVGPHRPRPRLRQEHLALARGDPAARRAGGDRVAGAGVVVQQGLRRRDARPAGRRAADRDPGDDGGLGLAGGARASAPTTSARPARPSTWWPRSAATRPPAVTRRGLA